MTPADLTHLRQLYERYDRTAGSPARLWLLLRELWPALDRWMPALLWRAERVAQLEAAIERQAARIRELEAQDARRRERQRIYKARHQGKRRALKAERVAAIARAVEAGTSNG